MPPHCDTLDGPVVTAAKKALEAGDVKIILPFVPKEGEAEINQVYDKVIKVRKDPAAREIADLYFFETVVRIHRMGEGAPYEGLKPAGLDEGPVIPVAEKAIQTGSSDELVKILSKMIEEEVTHRLHHVMHLKESKDKSVEDAREYVEAMLGLQVWAHAVHERIHGSAHGGEHHHG